MRYSTLVTRLWESAVLVIGSGAACQYLPDSMTYGIPYRCLLPETVEGLLVAGRCLSADHETHASVRSMGQTAGVAAVIALADRIMPHEVDSQTLRDRLTQIGAAV